VRDRAAETEAAPRDEGARAQEGGAIVAVPPWGPYPGYGGYTPWGWYPWYVAPQTYYPYSQYPPSITHVPRLGLQYNYPFALQMGIRVPDDSSPLDSPPNMGPFVGVVQAAKEQLAAEEAQAAEAAAAQEPPPRPAAITRRAVGLMKEGQFVEAGRVLAAAFEAADDPRYPLLLTEVFFALGKSDRAETILRYALRLPSALKAIPRDVKGHFPPAMDLEARVQELVATRAQPLLAAYLLAQTAPDRGIDLLGKLTAKSADDDAAALLYRHFLGKTFDAGGSGDPGEPGGSKDSR
jgi:tetratricopeptide (TPR) repeat protein